MKGIWHHLISPLLLLCLVVGLACCLTGCIASKPQGDSLSDALESQEAANGDNSGGNNAGGVSDSDAAASQTPWEFTGLDWSSVTYKGKLVNDGNFITGADVSSLLSLEKSGVVFYNAEGQQEDLLALLKDAGVNYIRVRVWNDPFAAGKEKTPENSYGGGVCDIEYACELAKRCAALELPLFVDFHYSDFWSDPGRAYAPKAWEGYSLEEKKAAIATFTIDSLKKIRQTGARIGMVSVGNETTGYMAGEQGIEKISGLIAAGAAAVRAFDADILIAVHFTNPEYNDYDAFAAQLQAAGADYDIFATSYYPTCHGTTQNLIAKMSRVAQAYGKLTMIAEYNYPVDGTVDAGVQMVFGKSDEAGQVQAICTVNQTAAQMAQGIGTFYWEPAWVQAPAQTWATQGSGWYNAPAAEYDLANASISGAQGSATSENALFDWSGRPRKAMQEKIFEQIRKVSP